MDIKFYAAFGTEEYLVNLTQMLGGGSYQIMVDNFYLGSINRTADDWKVYFNDRYVFSYSDGEILIDIITGEFKPAKLIQ